MDSSSATPGPCVIASVNYASTVVPLFHAAWLFALGIASTKAFWIKPSWILIALVLLSVLCGLAAVRAQRVAIVPVALLWLLVGAWCGSMEPQPAPSPALIQLSDGLLRVVDGVVVQAGPVRSEIDTGAEESVVS